MTKKDITWTRDGDRFTSDQGHTAEVIGTVVVITDKDGNIVAGGTQAK